MATSLISTQRIRAVIIAEATNQRSRENVVLAADGARYESGAILTKSGDAAAVGTAAARAGNTGNPTFGVIAVGAAGKPGVYNVRFTAPTKFDVEDPTGKVIGQGTTGVAFNKAGISFTLTAGATPAVDGDGFDLTVAAGSGKYSRYTANGAAGQADAVLYNAVMAGTAGDVKVVAFVRDAELNRYELTGLDAGAQASLAERGLIVRGTPGLPTISTPALV